MGLLMFLPTAVAPLLLVFAGLARIVGARGTSRSLMLAVGVMVLAPVILGPLLTVVPDWTLILALPVLGLMAAGAVVTAFLGRRVWDEMLGRFFGPWVGWLWLAGTLVMVVFVLL